MEKDKRFPPSPSSRCAKLGELFLWEEHRFRAQVGPRSGQIPFLLLENHPRPSRKWAWEPSFRNHSPSVGFVTPREELPDDRQAQEEKQCEP